MLTLNVSGKDNAEAVNVLKESLNGQESDVKILIDNPSQGTELQKYLESEGFNHIIPEDDDGTLYLTASKAAPKPPEKTEPKIKAPVNTEPKTYGIVLASECRQHEREFLEKVIMSLNEAKTKPDVLCLMNGAVKLAAYNSPSCDILKKLEADGVRVLISRACSDRLGITEALGAGTLVPMSEILEAVSSCEKLLSL